MVCLFFFFNATATTETYTLSLHDALPISILGLDPPDHTRLRRLVQRTFTPRAIGRMREQTVSIVESLLDDLSGRDRIDLIADYAFVVPFTVIHRMLGLPDADMAKVREWSGALTQTLEPFLSPEQVTAAMHAGEKMDTYLTDAIEWKRHRPAEDLLTALTEAEEEGDRLDSGELLSMVSLLFIAGHETTVNLIGNGTHALLRHPEQMELVRSGLSDDETMTDELLRYDSPVDRKSTRLNSSHALISYAVFCLKKKKKKKKKTKKKKEE